MISAKALLEIFAQIEVNREKELKRIRKSLLVLKVKVEEMKWRKWDAKQKVIHAKSIKQICSIYLHH